MLINLTKRFRDDVQFEHEILPFPVHLEPFIFHDPRSYLVAKDASSCVYEDAEDEAAFRFQPGNWVRRWQVRLSSFFLVQLVVEEA